MFIHENSLVSVYFFHSEKTHHCIFVLIKSPIYPPFQTFPLTLRRCICFHAAHSTQTRERASERVFIPMRKAFFPFPAERHMFESFSTAACDSFICWQQNHYLNSWIRSAVTNGNPSFCVRAMFWIAIAIFRNRRCQVTFGAFETKWKVHIVCWFFGSSSICKCE